MAGSPFVGTQSTPFTQLSPFTQLGPYALSPYGGTPFTIQPQPYTNYPLQQLTQVLQIVPQQLQQLQQLAVHQQVQLQQIQQLVQQIPWQIAQLQQAIQYVPHQLQQLQQPQPPFSQVQGMGGFTGTPPYGITPQIFGAQPGHVM